MSSLPQDSQRATPDRDSPAANVPSGDGRLTSLLPPPRGPRRLRLMLLATLSLICLATAASLYPAACYALSAKSPLELGELSSADLERASAADHQWVSASGELGDDGVAFTRKGANSGFVLTRLAKRNDVWLLLPTFGAHSDKYIPPRHFSGRLLRRDQLGLALRPVALLIDGASGKGTDYLLIDGALPESYRTELVAFVLLALTGVLSLLRLAYLTRKVREPAAEASPLPASAV